MLVVATVPLEGVYLVTVLACALIGFVAMRWHGLTRGTGAFGVGGFLYVLGRTSLVVGLSVITWKQILTVDVSMVTWQSLAYHAFHIIFFGFMTLTSAFVLAWSVVLDRFGANDEAARP